MTTTADVMLAKVASWIGFHETPVNITPFGAWYAPGFQGAAWCDMFISYCADQVGAADIIGKFAWTPSHAQWFANRGQWGQTPQRGAIAFFDWGGSKNISAIDHVAIVESVDANGQAVTIDGNYDDRVARWRHPMWQFAGFGYPEYSVSAYRPPVDTWDGKSYPGRAAFDIGSMHPAVTRLGVMLVKAGFGGAYREGPGVPMGPADVDNCAAFQRAQGWTGADADGYPGPETWARLTAIYEGGSVPPPSPPPPPPPPAEKVPPTQGYQGNVYLGKLHVGQNDSDSVRVFQRALRNYPDISTIPLNPSGVTGNYGNETAAMCRKVYETFQQWQPSAGWNQGNLNEPGPALLAKLGCRIVG